MYDKIISYFAIIITPETVTKIAQLTDMLSGIQEQTHLAINRATEHIAQQLAKTSSSLAEQQERQKRLEELHHQQKQQLAEVLESQIEQVASTIQESAQNNNKELIDKMDDSKEQISFVV